MQPSFWCLLYTHQWKCFYLATQTYRAVLYVKIHFQKHKKNITIAWENICSVYYLMLLQALACPQYYCFSDSLKLWKTDGIRAVTIFIPSKLASRIPATIQVSYLQCDICMKWTFLNNLIRHSRAVIIVFCKARRWGAVHSSCVCSVDLLS